MKEGPNSGRRLLKILLFDNGLRMQKEFRTSCEHLNLELVIFQDYQALIAHLNRTFYQIAVLNLSQIPKSHSNHIIKDIRAIYGYERSYIIVISESQKPENINHYLEQGADGYLPNLVEHQDISAHLSMYVRRAKRQQLREIQSLKAGMETGTGCILYCTEHNRPIEIPINQLQTKVIIVKNEGELMNELYFQKVWVVMIASSAKWALELVSRIKAIENSLVQVILLRTNHTLDKEIVQFFNEGGDDLLNINKSAFIIGKQINSRIEREQYYKDKYLQSLRKAASLLPIRLEKELKLSIGHWQLEVVHQSFDNVPGGDLYEIIHLENGNQLVLLGDIMGKEWGAWFLSLAYLSYIRSSIRYLASKQNIEPAGILRELNEALCKDFKLSEVFITLTILLLVKEQSKVLASSAAGLPMFLLNNEGRIETVRLEGALPGLTEKTHYYNHRIQLNPGDQLLLFSDGYLEAPGRNKDSVLSAFQQFISEHREVCTGALTFDQRFLAQHPQPFDDRTLISIKLLG